MSNFLSGVETSTENAIQEDRLGGGGGLFETDIYLATCKTAYFSKSAGGAHAVNFIFDIDGRELRETIYVSNKQGGVTYPEKDRKTGKPTGKHLNLPGYNIVAAAANLLTGNDIGALETEERAVNIYDFDLGEMRPQSVPCLIDMHGKECYIAVQKQTVDKNEKDGNGDYVPSGETRDENTIIQFFAGEYMASISEVNAYIKKTVDKSLAEVIELGQLTNAIDKMQESDTKHAAMWLEKNQGKTYMKAKGAKKAAGASFSGASTTSTTKELF